MRIKSVSIYNFRSLKSMIDVDLSKGLDVFIGQNDCGKSTFLQALKLFFEPGESCKFETGTQRNDLSFLAEEHTLLGGETVKADEVGILCTLNLDSDDIAQSNSSLAAMAIEGQLTILKKCAADSRYKPGKTVAKKDGYFVLVEKFKNKDFNNFGSSKMDEKSLIALMEKYPASKEFLVNANDKGKPENSERITALLSYARKHEARELEFTPFSFPAKAPYDAIWPEFTLIETKTPLDGKHKIIDDAFKKIDSKIEKKFETDLKKIKEEAKEEYSKITAKITSYAQSHYIAQLEEFKALPTVKLAVARDLVLKRFGQKDLSHFDQQGDGTKRRMMVAILQVSASVLTEMDASETSSEVSDKEKTIPYEPLRIWAFDEPEMHLHPGAQRDLFNSFRRFEKEGFQIVCSTHSTVFVNNSNLSAVHLIELDKELCSKQISKDSNLTELIKGAIGLKNSDVFFSNLFVIVEGATETGALPVFYENIIGVPSHTDGISIIDAKGCSKSPEKVDFFQANLGKTLCLFDTDAKSSLGKKGVELEKAKIITFIGTADFEDAFEDSVWLEVLQQNFPLKNPDDQSDYWTSALLVELRNKISQTDSNKKFLKLIESSYGKAIHEWKIDGNGTHPYEFDKVEIGKLLAVEAIKLKKVPSAVIDFVKLMNDNVV